MLKVFLKRQINFASKWRRYISSSKLMNGIKNSKSFKSCPTKLKWLETVVDELEKGVKLIMLRTCSPILSLIFRWDCPI
jgi:hypothetical protein